MLTGDSLFVCLCLNFCFQLQPLGCTILFSSVLTEVLRVDILRRSERLLYLCLPKLLVEKALTSLRKQLDVALKTLGVIREKLENCNEYPPCCLSFHKNNRISCDILGPMSEEVFLMHCERCKATMKEFLEYVYQLFDGNRLQDHKKEKIG